MDESGPMLVITFNQTWITNHGLINYNQAMDVFATYNLTNRRRDQDSRYIFHFRDSQEMYFVRDNIFLSQSGSTRKRYI